MNLSLADLLKNIYNETYLNKLIAALTSIYPDFPGARFKKAVFADDWEALELKQRMRRITVSLRDALPESYADAVRLLMNVIPTLKGLIASIADTRASEGR